MADTIEEIAIGNASSLVAADLTINFSSPSVTGTLSTLVGGVQVPVAGLTLNTAGGVTTVSGTTQLGTGVSVQFAGLNPVNATTTVAALGVPVVTLQETAAVVCYASGTHIQTDQGEVAVELLEIGDIAITASGDRRPIRWIGHRSYAARFANANPDLLPICIKAGALSDGVPCRDLWVSPKHALFLDGVLMPAASLVNGVSIVKAGRIDESLVYWHVELEGGHDIILAENTPAESFVDDNGRGIFHNALSFYALYPDAVEAEARYCAPRVENGHLVAAARGRLSERAGMAKAALPLFGDLQGQIDICDGCVISGWAQDTFYPDAPVCLDVLVDGELIAMIYADTYRSDLEASGFGKGRHGYSLALPLTSETGHTVEVRRSADSAALPGSPRLVAIASARAA